MKFIIDINEVDIDVMVRAGAILKNLEKGNLPSRITMVTPKALTMDFFHNDDESDDLMSISLTKRDLFYSIYHYEDGMQRLIKIKRLMFNPQGGLTAEEIFFLNKEIEFFKTHTYLERFQNLNFF